ncbi:MULTISPECIES: hypothetical protein [Glutamicibacter]|uniref:DUF1795 domain-containing protein n=1 Tax=Glutamicibacter halophytocola TaxID=1933880 RepID=A0A5B8I334_9MICC|nr:MULTISPECIES: hypothetical protein [Glutamicibacter]MBF6671979.1 hypothetical protein [Glutamicibacter sp. FBE19]QDY67225.1 hypothetical protein FQA45_13375 [Glutamicibacter halophytocola]UUX59397.1 hypothetical protein NUH22_01775 [Glutamicibacter halophytocola]
MGTKSSNTSAIANATGIPWDTWSSQLEDAKAGELTHKEIAELAFAHMPPSLDNPGWWAQSVAVAYEQQIGRRLPGQAQDGTFQGSVSTTLAADLDTALARWEEQVSGMETFNGQTLAEPARTSGSERWRYWRASFSDGTKAQVDIGLKGDKSAIAINITKAETPDQVSEWKRFWRQILDEFKQ